MHTNARPHLLGQTQKGNMLVGMPRPSKTLLPSAPLAGSMSRNTKMQPKGLSSQKVLSACALVAPVAAEPAAFAQRQLC